MTVTYCKLCVQSVNIYSCFAVMRSDGADMYGIQERVFTAWVENGGGSQNINVVVEPSVKLRQHSVFCCKEHVNLQSFAWATCS